MEHHWNEELTWLHNLSIKPPTFRQSLWLKTNKSSKTKIKHLYNRLLLVLVHSPNVVNAEPIIPSIHRIDVIWRLIIIFESLLLFPLENTEDGTATQINKRIHLFKTGRISVLYKKSRSVKSKSPEEKQKGYENMSEQTNNKCA